MQYHNENSSNLKGLMRTHTCGELKEAHVGQEVILCGWLTKYRDLGGLHFIDLRDKFGITQLSFEEYKGDITLLKKFSLESVLRCKGVVRKRPDSARNDQMKTGAIEILVSEIEELSHAEEVPFLPHGMISATEDLRLKYRYLDLRTNKLQEILSLRSKSAQVIRQALYEEGFTEVETPILYKTTPEGARDYVVPSRVHPGKVYALPQSPQTLKQLLMIGNTDKYFQICKCFRDEDLRAERQPEFTQIDMEVSFATQEYIKNITTKVAKRLFSLPENFDIPVMSYTEAMNKYGCDKPDIRFGFEHSIVTELFSGSGFSLFEDIKNQGGMVKAFYVPKNLRELTRKEIDSLTEVVKPHGGKGVAWFKLDGEEVTGGISKFITKDILQKLKKEMNSDSGIYLFFGDKKHSVAHACADVTRRHLANLLGLINPNEYKFLWVNDFPLLEYDEELQRFFACHHPFTMPKRELISDFMSGDKDKLMKLPAEAYDMVCNGYEIGGGSLRIYNGDVQSQMFKVLGFTKEEVERQFGFFVEALKYGTPPHAGFAFGFDRIMMLLAKTDSIRDVIAFPKTNSATDLMAQAPSIPNEDQLKELHMSWNLK